MYALVLPNRGFGFSTSVAFKPTLQKSIFSDKEIADGVLCFASRRKLIQLSVSSIRSKDNRRGRSPQRNTASDRAVGDDDQKFPPSADVDSPESSDQKEIIALFRRIQSSISKGGSTAAKKRSSKTSKEKKSVESILDALNRHPARKQLREKGAVEQEDEALPQRAAAPKKESRKENSPIKDFKLYRPPSNFVKRSPISLPTTPKEKIGGVTRNGLPVAVPVESQLQRVDELKLPELKELAKSKGIKGYSKLKKGELVDLLKGLLLS